MTKEELEKEAIAFCNEVLCSVCENKTCTEHLQCREWRDRRAGYYSGAEPREKQVERLKQENAELKKQLEMSNKVYNDNLDYSHHIEEQLTETKDIISKFLNAKSIEETCVAESEAEKFLKEE